MRVIHSYAWPEEALSTWVELGDAWGLWGRACTEVCSVGGRGGGSCAPFDEYGDARKVKEARVVAIVLLLHLLQAPLDALGRLRRHEYLAAAPASDRVVGEAVQLGCGVDGCRKEPHQRLLAVAWHRAWERLPGGILLARSRSWLAELPACERARVELT